MDEKLTRKIKYLGFKGLLTNWEKILTHTDKTQPSYEKFLTEIIEKEFGIKKENARVNRIRRATIEELLVIETYPFEKQPKLNKRKILQAYDSRDYLKQHKNIVFIGPTGVGKSGLASAFLINAINHGYSGKFITFADLVDELYKSIADHTQKKVIKKYLSFDCLVVDEVGYVPMEPAQIGRFFTLMSKRHKKKTTIITSNLGFKDWTDFLKNTHLTAALIDRLTSNCLTVNMQNCASLR